MVSWVSWLSRASHCSQKYGEFHEWTSMTFGKLQFAVTFMRKLKIAMILLEISICKFNKVLQLKTNSQSMLPRRPSEAGEGGGGGWGVELAKQKTQKKPRNGRKKFRFILHPPPPPPPPPNIDLLSTALMLYKVGKSDFLNERWNKSVSQLTIILTSIWELLLPYKSVMEKCTIFCNIRSTKKLSYSFFTKFVKMLRLNHPRDSNQFHPWRVIILWELTIIPFY